jgi:hypothetical protein
MSWQRSFIELTGAYRLVTGATTLAPGGASQGKRSSLRGCTGCSFPRSAPPAAFTDPRSLPAGPRSSLRHFAKRLPLAGGHMWMLASPEHLAAVLGV